MQYGCIGNIWLSPTVVKKQAAVIVESLKLLVPKHSADFDTNFMVFIDKINELDAQLHSTLQTSKGLRFMVFHPSWGYFTKDYGLLQVPIEIEVKVIFVDPLAEDWITNLRDVAEKFKLAVK